MNAAKSLSSAQTQLSACILDPAPLVIKLCPFEPLYVPHVIHTFNRFVTFFFRAGICAFCDGIESFDVFQSAAHLRAGICA